MFRVRRSATSWSRLLETLLRFGNRPLLAIRCLHAHRAWGGAFKAAEKTQRRHSMSSRSSQKPFQTSPETSRRMLPWGQSGSPQELANLRRSVDANQEHLFASQFLLQTTFGNGWNAEVAVMAFVAAVPIAIAVTLLPQCLQNGGHSANAAFLDLSTSQKSCQRRTSNPRIDN